jgi:hypothetical protein
VAVGIGLMPEYAAASQDEGNALLVLPEHATFTLPVIRESYRDSYAHGWVRLKEIAFIPAARWLFRQFHSISGNAKESCAHPNDVRSAPNFSKGSAAAFFGRDASNRPPGTVINSVTCSVSAGLGNNPRVGLRNSWPAERRRALAPFNSLA